LRERLEDRRQLGERLFLDQHFTYDEQGGQQPVTGGQVIHGNKVAAGLAPEDKAALAHGVEDLPIADADPFEADSFRLEAFVESQIAHDCGHHGEPLEDVPARPTASQNGQDSVAIDDPAMLIREDDPVAIPIVRDPEIRPFSTTRPAILSGCSLPIPALILSRLVHSRWRSPVRRGG
jgi:hypothetical protein